MKRNLLNLPFYPILIGLFPVLYLWSANLGQIGSGGVVRALAASLIFAVVVTAACLLIVRRRAQGSALAGLILFLFFVYGNVYNLLKTRPILGFEMGFVKLLIVFGVLFILGVILIFRTRSDLSTFTTVSNLMFGVLVLFALVQIGVYQARVTNWKNLLSAPKARASAADKALPDVYYIILDGYSRSDILQSHFQYDNSKFIEGLKQRGFYIPQCAFSNYFATSISLTSSLNMSYLEDLGFTQDVYLKNDDPAELYQALHQNQVRQIFAQHGYQFGSFRGFFPLNDFTDSNYYFDYNKDQRGSDLATRNFENLFIKTTALRAFTEYYQINPDAAMWKKIPLPIYAVLNPDSDKFSSRSYQWYSESMYTFDELVKIPDLPGNKFIYAHVYATHQPYVMRADGSFLWPINEDNFNYIPAVNYVSGRMLQVIDDILRKSAVPPIIIIQADHGFDLPGIDHNKILNAYYFPGGPKGLYPTITPVNTFRVVLHNLFNEPLDVLPDKVAVKDGPDKLHTVPVTCNP